MSTPTWDPATIKTQLRLASQRLGQLQEKHDSQSTIARRDIATLLQQGNTALARAKAQRLMDDDIMGDLLEVLEQHLGLIIEHFHELSGPAVLPSPTIVEAASSIIYAAPFVDFEDLHLVRDILAERLGPDFTLSASRNQDHYVPIRVLNAISPPPPSASMIDEYLMTIAKGYSINWVPESRRQDIANTLAEVLDPASSPIVDLPRLRTLCARGIPDEPSFLRPRIWKLFFGILPVLKSSWSTAMRKHRDNYYDLVLRLLEPFSTLPPPTSPLGSLDTGLLKVSNQLSSIPSHLFYDLETESDFTGLSPLEPSSPAEFRISCATNLDTRLKLIRREDEPSLQTAQIPEIRLESETSGQSHPSRPAPLILSPRKGNVSQKHMSALLRLLYVHFSINPGNLAPHVPALLVPMYSTLCQEIYPEDAAHAEADTFWLFEALVGEFSELEDEEGGSLWVKKLGDRVAWADVELKDNLVSKGLDPGLPHYSYRWLAPVLTQTLPLSSILVAWDAIFSYPMATRSENPKLNFLLDVCAAMLIRARAILLRLGKGPKSPSLWSEENITLPPPSPVRAWELGDAFLEGITLLQSYPIETAGGIDRILQTASDLANRRAQEALSLHHEPLSLTDRLKKSMWKGFTNQMSSPQLSPVASDDESEGDDSDDDGNETETTTTSGFGSQLASKVWRGITSRNSEEDPSQNPSSQQSLSSTTESSSSARSRSFWSYAEKLKDSDTAATLSKVSSNWRAKAMSGPWGISTSKSETSALPVPERKDDRVRNSAPVFHEYEWNDQNEHERRVSLPIDRSGVYSPPARPVYFRQPRDTVMFSGSNRPPSIDVPTETDQGGGFMSKTKNLQVSLAALTRSQTPQPAPKSGPRPLLLSSSNLMSTPGAGRQISRSLNSTPIPDRQQTKTHKPQRSISRARDSLSSVSSLGHSSHPSRSSSQSDWDSDAGYSRKVPINRRSVSPMAPNFQLPPRHVSTSSEASDSPLRSPSGTQPGWGRVDVTDSPPLSSPPQTPVHVDTAIRVSGSETLRGSLVLAEPTTLEPVILIKELGSCNDTPESSVATVQRSPRLRSKRQPHGTMNLGSRRGSSDSRTDSPVLENAPTETDSTSTPRLSLYETESAASQQMGSSQRPSLRRSNGSRIKRNSSVKQVHDLASEEGDDEGYDDLLSAYDSDAAAKPW